MYLIPRACNRVGVLLSACAEMVRVPSTHARCRRLRAGMGGSSPATREKDETPQVRAARLAREVAHSVEFHKERLAADFPFVKREYLQKFALMGAVAEKKE